MQIWNNMRLFESDGNRWQPLRESPDTRRGATPAAWSKQT